MLPGASSPPPIGGQRLPLKPARTEFARLEHSDLGGDLRDRSFETIRASRRAPRSVRSTLPGAPHDPEIGSLPSTREPLRPPPRSDRRSRSKPRRPDSHASNDSISPSPCEIGRSPQSAQAHAPDVPFAPSSPQHFPTSPSVGTELPGSLPVTADLPSSPPAQTGANRNARPRSLRPHGRARWSPSVPRGASGVGGGTRSGGRGNGPGTSEPLQRPA